MIWEENLIIKGLRKYMSEKESFIDRKVEIFICKNVIER